VAVLEALGKRIPELPPAIPRIQVAKDLDKTLIPSEDPLQKRIFIHPGFSKASEQKGYLKSWRVQAWQDFIKGILRRVPDASVYLLGGPEDERLVSKIGQVCQSWPFLPRPMNGSIFRIFRMWLHSPGRIYPACGTGGSAPAKTLSAWMFPSLRRCLRLSAC
jgi:hypothetical protein